jgi:tight adherence protein B
MDPIYYAFVVLVFVAVVLAVEGIYIWWNSKHGHAVRRIDSRIRALSAGGHVHKERLTILKDRMFADASSIDKLLAKMPRFKHFDLLIQQSGLTWSVSRLILTSLTLTLAVFALALVLSSHLALSAAAALAAGASPFFYVARKRQKRLRKLERQLPDTADTISRAMRAGHSLPSALGMVGNEFAEPMAGEFRITFDEINYGVSMNEALMNLATRVPIRDLRYFVIAVLIQRETGGNLAELLDNIAFLLRERFKLFDKVRALSAEGKMSAWVLGVLPFVTAGAMLLFNREFLEVLWTDPIGVRMLAVMAVLMVLGVFWMRRVINLRV